MTWHENKNPLTDKAELHSLCRGGMGMEISKTKIRAKKYYHATTGIGFNFKEIKPNGYYEDTSKGCPQEIFEGAGFKLSNILESSFSKSPEACIIAMKDSDKETVIDIYSTEEEPDIDISDCGYDFSELEEVRYRRTITIKFYKRVTLNREFITQLQKCYPGDIPPDYTGLGCLKNHARNRLKKSNIITALDNNKFDECYAKEMGISVGELKQYDWYKHDNSPAINTIINDFLMLQGKTEIAFFGSVLDKPLRDIHDIDLVMTAPQKVYKELRTIAKKYNKPLDIFLPPLNDVVGKVIVHTSGRLEKAQVYTSDEFFDEVRDIKEILIIPREK